MLDWDKIRETLSEIVNRDPDANFRDSKKGVQPAKTGLWYLEQLHNPASRLGDDEDEVDLAFLAGCYYGWSTEENERSVRATEFGNIQPTRIDDNTQAEIVNKIQSLTDDDGMSKTKAVKWLAKNRNVSERSVWKILKKSTAHT